MRSVRPIPITVVTVAKGSSKGAELMAGEWADKLKRWAGGCGLQATAIRSHCSDHTSLLWRRYTALTQLQIKPNPKNAKETAVAVQHEGERVLKGLQPSDRVILLDERGRCAAGWQLGAAVVGARTAIS